MGKVSVPNLVLPDALRFCKTFDGYCWEDENEFDFSQVKTCDPFPMLIVAQKIRTGREEHSGVKCTGSNVTNTYAENMRFYRFVGMDVGKSLSGIQGNSNYQAISELKLFDLVMQSRDEGVALGELVTNTSRRLATVLSRGDKRMKETMTFCLREIIRNIPEHSCSFNGWYCAQYWPTYDLVELAIMDDGQGIWKSITSNYKYACEMLNNEEAIKKALQPGVSKTFDENGNEEIFANTGSKWKNSGYGLFVVSRICAKTGASFVLASGDKAVQVYMDNHKEIQYKTYDTNVSGTAISIKLKPSGIHRINTIMDEINEEGRKLCGDGFKSASKASYFHFDE